VTSASTRLLGTSSQFSSLCEVRKEVTVMGEDEQQDTGTVRRTCSRCGSEYDDYQQDSLLGGSSLCPHCDNQQYIAEYGY